MDLSWLTLVALAVVIVASCTARINPGVLAMVLAWLIAVYVAPYFDATLGFKELVAGFPSELFLNLTGVSLLFASAEGNGTLDRVARLTENLCRGNLGLIALLFFAFPFALGTLGPGNIAVAGLIAPVAMATAHRTGIPPFLMAIMVGHGAIACTLSPLTAGGLVADKKLADIGLAGHVWQVYAYNALANALVAGASFLLLGGWKLLRQWHREPDSETAQFITLPFERRHRITLAVIAVLVVAVTFAKAQIGMSALAAALVLIVLGVADERDSFRRIPWSVIVMVCGVSMLTSLMERTGGTDRFAELIVAVSTQNTVTAVLAFVTGVVSIFSSTTGVVVPAFLPMAGSMAEFEPLYNQLTLALAVIIGGNLVDISPLSTIGALCVAASPETVDRRRLFNRLLAWGFALSVVAAILCWVFLPGGRN